MKKKPPTKFTAALTMVFEENQWRLPDAIIVASYEERIRQLEAEIEVLTRAGTGRRINPLEKAIPS